MKAVGGAGFENELLMVQNPAMIHPWKRTWRTYLFGKGETFYKPPYHHSLGSVSVFGGVITLIGTYYHMLYMFMSFCVCLGRACFCRSSFSHQLTIRVHRAFAEVCWSKKQSFFFRIQILRCVGWIQHIWKVRYIFIYTYICNYWLLWISISSCKLFIRIQLFFTTRMFLDDVNLIWQMNCSNQPKFPHEVVKC